MFNYKPYKKRSQKRSAGEDTYANQNHAPQNLHTQRNSSIKSVRKSNNSNVLYPIPAPSYHAGLDRNVWQAELDKASSGLSESYKPYSGRPTRAPGLLDLPFPPQLSRNRQYKSFGNGDSTDYKQSLVIHKNNNENNGPIELVISNLDSSINNKTMHKLLLNMLSQYVVVLTLSIIKQTDGLPIAIVKIRTSQEAQYLISQLHHHWLGHKRLVISYAQRNSDLDQVRRIVIDLLQEVPEHRMPLFKFLALAKSRYHCGISLSDVNKLKDICRLIEGQNGRTIMLTSEARYLSLVPVSNALALHCSKHYRSSLQSEGWVETAYASFPNVNIALKLFAKEVYQLLDSHMGYLPLLSFFECYEAEFGRSLREDETGVPLEHLITCIPNIKLNCSGFNKNITFLNLNRTHEMNKKEADDQLSRSVSPSLMTNITMLSREIVDLLKNMTGCQLLLNRYIPAYHHHFGRQCRVADYGFTRLIDLFEAISHIVQILGFGEKRLITLTHSAQIRRFTSDLLRVLKSQVSKQITFIDFPGAYEKVQGKPFNPIDYGLCYLNDLLDEVPEGNVIIRKSNDIAIIAIPKREQTAKEIERTKQFAKEVIELLQHSPYCSMSFNQFVPAYHHHFNRQCKVSDYGFTKIAELFEAIPDTVEIEGSSDIDRKVKLKLELALEVLGKQIQTVIKESELVPLYWKVVIVRHKRTFSYPVNPQAYGCSHFEELFFKLSDYVEIIPGCLGSMLALSDVDYRTRKIRILGLLFQPPYSTNVEELISGYLTRFFRPLSMNKVKEMTEIVELFHDGQQVTVSLTNKYKMAAQIYHLLYINHGHMKFNALLNLYALKFGNQLLPEKCSPETFKHLLEEFDFLVKFEKGGKNLIVVLNKSLAEHGVSLPYSFGGNESAGRQRGNGIWSSPITGFGVPAPKPDTPPADEAWYNSLWNTPPKNVMDLNLNIAVPPIDTYRAYMNTKGVFSPFPDYSSNSNHINDNSHLEKSKVSSPHPTVLPLPDKLIPKDDSRDSGVHNSNYDFNFSNNEMPMGLDFSFIGDGKAEDMAFN